MSEGLRIEDCFYSPPMGLGRGMLIPLAMLEAARKAVGQASSRELERLGEAGVGLVGGLGWLAKHSQTSTDEEIQEAGRRLAALGGTMPDLEDVPRRRSETETEREREAFQQAGVAAMTRDEQEYVVPEGMLKAAGKGSDGLDPCGFYLIGPLTAALGWLADHPLRPDGKQMELLIRAASLTHTEAGWAIVTSIVREWQRIMFAKPPEPEVPPQIENALRGHTLSRQQADLIIAMVESSVTHAAR